MYVKSYCYNTAHSSGTPQDKHLAAHTQTIRKIQAYVLISPSVIYIHIERSGVCKYQTTQSTTSRKRPLFQQRRLDIQRETKTALHRALDFAREGEDFCRGATIVHQYQRVLGRDTDLAIACAFKAALFNQPGGGDFYRISARGEGRHGGVLFAQGGVMRGANHGVMEEAARVWLLCRVGQFATAQGADRGMNIRRVVQLVRLFAQAGVGGVQRAVFGQAQGDGADDVARAPVVLEAAVAVGKAAVSGGDVAQTAFVAVINLDAFEDVLQLDAVSADVLYRRGTGATGDESEVFRAVPAFARAPGGDRVPRFARLHLQEDAVAIFADDALAAVLRAEDARFDFLAADGVAAATEYAVAGRGGAPFVSVFD